MGRAIDMEKRLDELEMKLRVLEDAFGEQIQTRMHHVDLTESRDEVLESPPVKRKTRKTKKKEVKSDGRTRHVEDMVEPSL